ncbi:MAG TPA: hypothetical protein VMF07_10870 [Solirubrobacteraceae bacterium]|nr:hypothetical protein [Solirubrobacteraceae bacterium]
MSSSSAVTTAPVLEVPSAGGGGAAGNGAAPPLWRWWVWALVGLAVIGGAVAVVLASGMTPSFDAYGWLVWGHQILYGNLNLNAAPSWKPLMIIFTLPMALFGTGDVPPRLLAIVTTAGTLATAPFAARIAYRLLVGDRGPTLTRRVRIAAWIGGLFALVGVLGLQGYPIPAGGPPQSLWRLTFIADSDPLCAAIVLAAFDAHLARRPKLAYILLFFAGLNRPEAWAILGLYGLYLMWKVPGTRALVLGSWVLTAVAWYLPTALAAKSIFQASKLDQGKASTITGEPVWPVLQRWATFYEWPMQVAALLGVVFGLLRRERAVLLITAACAVWLAVEMLFALHGFSAVARYMIEPADLMIAVAGYGIAQALAGPWEGLRRRCERWTLAVAAPLVAVGLMAGLGYFLHIRQSRVRALVPAVRNYGKVKSHLTEVVARAGGPAAVLACGPPAAKNQFQTQMAWTLGLNGNQVLFNPSWLIRHHTRMVLFTQTPANGWVVRAYNMPASIAARCDREMAVTVPSS